MLGLDHDPAGAVPALARTLVEFIEHPAGPSRLEEALLGMAMGLETQGVALIIVWSNCLRSLPSQGFQP